MSMRPAASPSRQVGPVRTGGGLLLLIGSLAFGAGTEETVPPLPSFAELEAAGARIGEIRIVANEIFDTDDPQEDTWLFRLANKLHMRTRPGVVRRALLFRSGEPVSVQKLEETERTLRSTRYLYDVTFRVLAFHDGVADMEVATRDTWTLDGGVSFGRTGGANSTSVYLKDYNILGTGIQVGYDRSSDVDRTGTEFFLLDPRLLGSHAELEYARSRSSDGHAQRLSLTRPFHALDARWAAGLKASEETRLDSVYTAGIRDRQYRAESRGAEVFGGWSAGLVEDRVQRYSMGMSLQEQRYTLEPGRTPPDQLPDDGKDAGPFVRYELLDDRYEKLSNRNVMGRPEYFGLGWAAMVRLGRSERSLGATRTGWLYTGRISRGTEFSGQWTVIASAAMDGAYLDGKAQLQRGGFQLHGYAPQSPRWLFYAAASFDRLSHAGPAQALTLGGDNGLRGYPLRYQSGRQRALVTLEERRYTDWFVWRLFRLGGAVFLDTGRAWGGAASSTVNPGWLSDAGMGLRIVSARSAFSNVLHLDVAYALNPAPGIKRTQFLVKAKATF